MNDLIAVLDAERVVCEYLVCKSRGDLRFRTRNFCKIIFCDMDDLKMYYSAYRAILSGEEEVPEGVNKENVLRNIKVLFDKSWNNKCYGVDYLYKLHDRKW